MDIHTLITCLIAVTLLTLTPGIDTFLVIRNSVRGGKIDGTISSLGICSGLLFHAFISAIGVSLILLHTAWAFYLLKMAGSAYLIWLGITSLTKAFAGSPKSFSVSPVVGASKLDLMRSFREGVLSNILNPKAVIFYMAFLPQFIDPEQNVLVQSMIVAGIHAFVAMVWQCFIAVMVDRAKSWFENRKVDRILNGSLGSVMMFLGLRLLFEE